MTIVKVRTMTKDESRSEFTSIPTQLICDKRIADAEQ